MRAASKLLALACATAAIAVLTIGAGTAAATPGASQVSLSGTGSPQTGAFTPSGDFAFGDEFAGAESEDGPDAYSGNIIDRSLSGGIGAGVGVNSGKKAKSNPTLATSFEGLNHYQQRYSRGGNQFSLEPPDQGLCVGNGYVVEAVNDVLNIYNAAGQSVLPDNTATNIVSGFPRDVNHAVDLNSFYGYAAAVNRSLPAGAPRFGPELTDPTCIYDAQTQRFFMVVLTLDTNPVSGGFTTVNHLDLAVSQTSNPTGSWNIYKIDVTADGSPGNTGGPCPCLGDYPHIGADANGIYLTTNAYPWGPGDFDGAQIYALSKASLAAGAASVSVTHIDTTGMVNATSPAAQTEPGFTVWPAQSPANQFDSANGGTEYFLSSNAGEEAAGAAYNGSSTNLVAWTLSNTSSLNSATPAVSLSNKVLDVGQYGIPPKQKQPGSGAPPAVNAPQGFCLNDSTTVTIAGVGCWKLLVSATAHAAGPEVVQSPDSNDTRMQQVVYANGKLWGALDTALNPDGGPQRAGIAYYVVNPHSSKVSLQGYLGATGHDFTYPAIGVTSSGRGVMAFTDTGNTTYPSAAYASIDAIVGVGSWNDIALGAAPDDGFSGYKQQRFPNGIRSRWGDYGAASVDGSSVWIASEYIGQSCNYTDWGGPFFAGGTGDNLLGTCGGASHGPGPRTALANWSTRISKLTP
jgi:hypothetical protein